MTVRDLPTPPVGNPTVWKNRIVDSGFENPEQLLAHPANWRVHPKHQQDALEAVLDEVGYVDRVLVNRTTGFVVDGHLRVAVGISRGETAIPVDYLDLTEQEEALILATFDAITGMATTDKEKLKALLDIAKPQTDAARDVLEKVAAKGGVRRGESNVNAEPQIDKADELQKVWQVKPGDLWSIPALDGQGEHLLLCGDATVKNDVSRVLRGTRATMVFTDPPWNVAIGQDSNPRHRQRDGLKNDSLSAEDFTQFLRDFASLIVPILDGDFYCVLGASEWGTLDRVLREVGFHWSATVIWVKDMFVLGRSNYHRRYEPIWYGWRNDGKSSFTGARDVDDVWEIPRPRISEEHPTMKPVELVDRAIINSSGVRDVVFDPFGGSGTTLLSASRQNRLGRSIELEPKFCSVILQRMKDSGHAPVRAK